jgi:hypothetical protein
MVIIPADYWLILFVLSLTDLFKYQYLTAPRGGRFPDWFSYCSAFLSQLNSTFRTYS